MMDSPCAICGSVTRRKILAKVNLVAPYEHDLTECLECGVRRFEPLPEKDELGKFYAPSYYDFPRHREEGYGRALAKKLEGISPRGKLLDVGCATGHFIKGVRDSTGWEVYGVEFGTSAADYARQNLGLNVKNCSLEEASYPEGYFDYVRINNVLEHVNDPVSMLRECRRIISPIGTLYLAVPNGSNDSREIVDFHKEEGAIARSKNGHIYFFQAKTLSSMFEKCGFEVEKSGTAGFKRGLRNMGFLPRKAGWKTDYYPRGSEGTKKPSLGHNAEGKKRPVVYYQLRQIQNDLLTWRGLHGIGLDFIFELKPKIPQIQSERCGK